MTATAQQVHTLVGIFRSVDDAHQALRHLDHERIPPQHVSLIANDPELAGDVGGRSFAVWGAVAGAALGLILAAAYVAFGGPTFRVNPVGIVLGAAFVAGGLAFIGLVFGRAFVVRSAHGTDYEHAVEEGGAVVTVACVPEECEQARTVLGRAGADEIVEEEHAERV